MKIHAQLSYNMTNQFLMASNLFLRRATILEGQCVSGGLDERELSKLESEHKGLITSILMQCVSALETTVYTVITNGPGHHLGTNGINHEAKEYLRQFEDVLEKIPTLEKFQNVLCLMRLEKFSYGERPLQDVNLLVSIRNELIHYKPIWVYPFQDDSEVIMKKLKSLKLEHSPFPGAKSIYFPSACLSCALGGWALQSTLSFLDRFFEKIGSGNPIKGYYDWIKYVD